MDYRRDRDRETSGGTRSHKTSRTEVDYRRKRRQSRSRSKSPRDSRHQQDRSYRSTQEDRHSHRHDRRQREETNRDRDRSPRRDDRRRPAREKDWDNFFNPNSNVKREHEDEDSKYGKKDTNGPAAPNVEKEKPNFGLSGKLTEETNTFRGVVIKYSEPPEARKPQKIRWRLYPFKGEEALPVMYIHRQSAYLLGRERKIADIPIDHPSCSKQHAVIQFRLVQYEKADGSKGRRIKPYVIDLESGNGTFVNGKQIEPRRYVELFEKDVLKFGFSTREYVLLHEHSKDDPEDDEFENSPEVDEKVRIKVENTDD